MLLADVIHEAERLAVAKLEDKQGRWQFEPKCVLLGAKSIEDDGNG